MSLVCFAFKCLNAIVFCNYFDVIKCLKNFLHWIKLNFKYNKHSSPNTLCPREGRGLNLFLHRGLTTYWGPKNMAKPKISTNHCKGGKPHSPPPQWVHLYAYKNVSSKYIDRSLLTISFKSIIWKQFKIHKYTFQKLLLFINPILPGLKETFLPLASPSGTGVILNIVITDIHPTLEQRYG